MELTRRNLIELGGMAVAGAGVHASGTAAVANAEEAAPAFTYAAGHQRVGMPEFFAKPEPIVDIAQIYEYEIVVVGAGSPGVPCALKAFEDGAHVALITKEVVASAFGNTGSGIILEKSNPADVANIVALMIKESQYRANRELVELWAQNSGEAVTWLLEKAEAAGAKYSDVGNAQHAQLLASGGYDVQFVTSYFGPKPYNTGDAMQDIVTKAQADGLEVFFETRGIQLVQDETGRVTGIIAQNAEGDYVQFNASKAVVLATGDYQNDTDMLYYYLPDMRFMEPKQFGRHGDGHKMVIWAGGKMEDIGHTKMLHDFDAGPVIMGEMPFLRVKMNGKRFCYENSSMSVMNCFLLSEQDRGHYCQVFDASYMEKYSMFGPAVTDPEALKHYMPEEEIEHQGVFPGLIGTFKADTLEELAEKLEVTDVEAFVASVERWNEICAAGSDPDFGLEPEFLQAIDTPPFYGIHRHVRMSQICSGVDIDGELRVLDVNGEPIEGLYAIGNLAGGFFGGIDYPLSVAGNNLGNNYTQGYVLGKRLAQA